MTVALAAQKSGLPLRRTLSGSADRYAVKCQMVMIPPAGMGGTPRTTTATWDATYQIGKASGSKAPLTVQVQNFQIDQPALQGMKPSAPARARTIQGTIDSSNRISVGDGKNGTTLNWLVADLIPFPSTPARIGSQWNVALPSSIILGDSHPQLKAKITGERKVGGRSAWVIAIDGSQIPFQQKAQISMAGSPNQEATISGKADVHLQTLVEKATGRTLELTGRVKKNQEMRVPGVPMATPSQTEYTASMRLKG